MIPVKKISGVRGKFEFFFPGLRFLKPVQEHYGTSNGEATEEERRSMVGIWPGNFGIGGCSWFFLLQQGNCFNIWEGDTYYTVDMPVDRRCGLHRGQWIFL
ncbi:MAG: hypothetical protein CVV44_12570 [Spirochaetae bacterium HGW-Spirochaetae-1]|jgi:hypothetical protein|nr:MAG: hypothetical protein CVV44_12570 [Spirochaetae bacterium HGW-Spirochaetae-1]